jgi:hypothetical protein
LIAVKTYTTYPILLFCGRYGYVLFSFLMWNYMN